MSIRRKQRTPLWQTLIAPDAVAEIHRQLYQGLRPGALARKVQGSDPPLFPGRPAKQVTDWLYAYHRKTIQPAWTRALLGAAHASRRDKLIQRLDVLVELKDLAVKLGARFERLLAHESRPVDEAGAPPPRGGVDEAAKNYRATLVQVARLYLETGLLHRVPRKIESALATAMAGRPVFEFTQEEIDRFDRASLLEGLTEEPPGAGEADEADEAGEASEASEAGEAGEAGESRAGAPVASPPRSRARDKGRPDSGIDDV